VHPSCQTLERSLAFESWSFTVPLHVWPRSALAVRPSAASVRSSHRPAETLVQVRASRASQTLWCLATVRCGQEASSSGGPEYMTVIRWSETEESNTMRPRGSTSGALFEASPT
jgi:hypothetical protein